MELSRRGLLTGMGAIMLAPAIVRVENLMPVKSVDIYDTRYLWGYQVASDRMILRIDRALHTLRRPDFSNSTYTRYVPAHIAHKFIPEGFVKSIRPAAGEQKHIDMEISAHDFVSRGWNPWS